MLVNGGPRHKSPYLILFGAAQAHLPPSAANSAFQIVRHVHYSKSPHNVTEIIVDFLIRFVCFHDKKIKKPTAGKTANQSKRPVITHLSAWKNTKAARICAECRIAVKSWRPGQIIKNQTNPHPNRKIFNKFPQDSPVRPQICPIIGRHIKNLSYLLIQK